MDTLIVLNEVSSPRLTTHHHLANPIPACVVIGMEGHAFKHFELRHHESLVAVFYTMQMSVATLTLDVCIGMYGVSALRAARRSYANSLGTNRYVDEY